MNIELVKLIIDPIISKQTCFLCFKQNEELNNIHSDMIIVKDQQEFRISVFKMVSYLFSLQEPVLQQVCDKCSSVIINIYILVQNHNLMQQNFIQITQNLDNEISNIKELDKKCYLKIYPKAQTPMETINRDNEIVNDETQDCQKCSMSFQYKDQLQEHKKIAHKNTNEALICHICGKNCKTSSSLKSHLNCHKEKQCPYCSKLLKTHSHYKIHVQNHISLSVTSKRKRNRTSYNCHDCSFTSLNKGSLEAHINKVHIGLRPYVCPVCCKGFFKKSNLTEHISIHDKVKTETCEICGDNFVCKKTLMEHLRLHKNQKPYKCDVCFKSFVTSGRRSDHVKRTHMEKSECCLICNKLFSLKKELNRHVKKSHWQSVPELVENFDNCAEVEMLMAIV